MMHCGYEARGNSKIGRGAAGEGGGGDIIRGGGGGGGDIIRGGSGDIIRGGGGGGDIIRGGGGGGGAAAAAAAAAVEAIERLASGGAVVIFSVSTCCMCHVVKRLLCGMGVNLTVYELDELEATAGQRIEEALRALVATSDDPPLPAVFVGGKLLGGLDHVMAAHISGALVPLLKDAGALWL